MTSGTDARMPLARRGRRLITTPPSNDGSPHEEGDRIDAIISRLDELVDRASRRPLRASDARSRAGGQMRACPR